MHISSLLRKMTTEAHDQQAQKDQQEAPAYAQGYGLPIVGDCPPTDVNGPTNLCEEEDSTQDYEAAAGAVAAEARLRQSTTPAFHLKLQAAWARCEEQQHRTVAALNEAKHEYPHGAIQRVDDILKHFILIAEE